MAVLDLARAGQFEEIRELFTPGLRPMVPPGGLQAAWEAEIAGVASSSCRRPGQRSGRRRQDHGPRPVAFERGEQTSRCT